MRRWMLVAGLIGLAACTSRGGVSVRERDLPEQLTVSSTAFDAGGTIPPRYTCTGDNVSPPLRWTGVPEGTAGVALVVDDPDAPRGTFVHWVLIGLDPASDGLAEGSVPPGARQLPNSAGDAAWAGPCPPGGPAHHYRFTVYALGQQPEVAGDADPGAAVEAIEAAATARGRLVALFRR